MFCLQGDTVYSHLGDQVTNWATVNWATQLWLLRGQCRKCDIPTVLTKYLWEYIVHYSSLCEDHRCLFMSWNLHIYLNLTDFHWLCYLHIRARIKYKIALGLLTFKIWTIYFSSKRHHFITGRYSDHSRRPRTTLGPGLFFGSRAFCHAAPASNNFELTTCWSHRQLPITGNGHLPPLPDNCHLAPSAGSGAANACILVIFLPPKRFWWAQFLLF